MAGQVVRYVILLLGASTAQGAIPDGAVSTNNPPAWVQPWNWVKPGLVLVQSIPSVADDQLQAAGRDVTRALLAAAIWVSYVLKSRRVKLTFVR